MPLTDREIRAAKPGERTVKLSDGGGLQLWIEPDGGKRWRLAYRFASKQKTLALGVYPSTGLKSARVARDDAKRLLAEGRDPSVAKKVAKLAAVDATANTFDAVARIEARFATLRAPQCARQPNSQGLHGPFLSTRPVHFYAAFWHILSPPLTPVLVTTSRLLSTGVDAQTCRLIVLDRPFGSMTEFKQIVGRGTRVHEDTRKFYFTLIDFRGATNHFADPEFDGDPVQIYEPGESDPITPPEDAPGDSGITEPDAPPYIPEGETVVDQPDFPRTNTGPARKIYVDGVGARIVAERVEYLDRDGRLVTESLRDFSRNELKKRFASLDDFLRRWKSAERKQAIIEELEAEGVVLEALADEVGKNLDPFDLICHVAFDQKPLTRRERAENVKKRDVFAKYGPQARAVLDALLEKYRDEGVVNLDDTNVLKIAPFSGMGSVVQLVGAFGGKAGFEKAIHELQNALYDAAG